MNYSVHAPEDVHTLVHLAITNLYLLVLLVLNKPLLALKGLPGSAREGVSGGRGTGARTRLFDEGFGSLTKIGVFVSLHIIGHLWEEEILVMWPLTDVYGTENPHTKNIAFLIGWPGYKTHPRPALVVITLNIAKFHYDQVKR